MHDDGNNKKASCTGLKGWLNLSPGEAVIWIASTALNSVTSTWVPEIAWLVMDADRC